MIMSWFISQKSAGSTTEWLWKKEVIIEYLTFMGHFPQKSPVLSGSFAEKVSGIHDRMSIEELCHSRIPYLHRSFFAKEPCTEWLFCGKRLVYYSKVSPIVSMSWFISEQNDFCHMGWLQSVGSILKNDRTLLHNIVFFTGLFCKRDL